MIRIEPYSLWLGHAGDCRDVTRALELGIEAVVQLAREEAPVQYPRDIAQFRIPLLDGAENSPALLRLAIETVEHLIRARIPTLVCCGAGMSRTPAIAAAALSRIEGQSPAESLEHVHHHLGTDITPTLWHDVVASVRETA